MKNRLSLSPLSSVDQATDPMSKAPIVAVGNVEQWQRAGHKLPANTDLYFCVFEQLNQTFIELFEPAVILTPVVSTNFDCADVALRLHDADYPGSVRALGRDLPRPEIVEREIRALCPALDFAILDIEDLLGLS